MRALWQGFIKLALLFGLLAVLSIIAVIISMGITIGLGDQYMIPLAAFIFLVMIAALLDT